MQQTQIDALAALMEKQARSLQALDALLEQERSALLALSAATLERLEQLREAKQAALAELERDEQQRRALVRALGYPHGDRVDTAACAALFELEPQWRRLLAALERTQRLNAQLAGLIAERSDFNHRRLAWARRQQRGFALYDARGRRAPGRVIDSR